MKNNTFKRVLAGSLALLTVAAYVPANVGGILPDLSIVASAIDNYVYLDNAQTDDGILNVAKDSVPFIEGLYEITGDAGAYVYTKVAEFSDSKKTFEFVNDKAYVLRTTAYVEGMGLERNEDNGEDVDLNGDALPAGVYEYKIANAGGNVVSVATVKARIKTDDTGLDAFPETPVITQNGVPIPFTAEGSYYEVAKGFPVSLVVTPAENHNNMMLTIEDSDVKSQTKSGKEITLTFVPQEGADVAYVSWTEYLPTLQLTKNADGTVTATDVGFNALVSNAVVGNYEFTYGYEGDKGFVSANVNAKGEYIAGNGSAAAATFTAKQVKVGNTTYDYVNDVAVGETEFQVWDEATGKWTDQNVDTTKKGKFRAITTVTPVAENAVLTENEFKIITEFTVVEASVTSSANLVFKAPNVGSDVYVATRPENGVYKVAWQNGEEITPVITLYKTAEAAAADDGDHYDEVEPGEAGDFTAEDGKYYVTGTTTASEPGTYTMTIVPIKKAFNDGEEIVITWQIVNTNNYVTLKKGVNDDCAFQIAYRQATSKTLKEEITKKLDFVGSTDLYIVKYTDEDGNEVADPSEKANEGFDYNPETGKFDGGTHYYAHVANLLKNDGKTGAMVKDGNVYDTVDEDGLYVVPFQVTPTKVLIEPAISEITYGDDVKLNELYKITDSVTKKEIGVPWAKDGAPTITLTNKVTGREGAATDSTKELEAGEYTYTVEATPRDTINYFVKQITAEDKVDFTVNARDLKDMDFGTVNVDIVGSTTSVKVTKPVLAAAANAIEANPVKFAIEGTDFNISGGTISAKTTDIGKSFTVNLQGTGNFTGTKTVTWVVGRNVLSDKVMDYEAEFDASKPRVMAKLDLNEVDGEVEECGFYFCNNGKMNDIPLDGKVDSTGKEIATNSEVDNKTKFYAQDYLTNLFKEVDETGANKNQKGANKVSFSQKAVTTALSGKGILTAEIANSSVLKQVYIMPYVKYKNGNMAYGKVESFNYYDMVLAAEGALEVTKTDVVGTGTKNADGVVLTKDKTYVKVDVTRVDKKGYEVERYGIVYNNSDSWNEDAVDPDDQKVTVATPAEMELAYTWLNIDYESEKNVKVAEVPAKDLAKKIGTNTYIANTTAKYTVDGEVKKDYGYGAKTVFAKAFIKIKDAAGNEKVYYSHLADVTYGGFTVNATTGAVKGTETGNAVLDSKNKNQILFYAPTDADVKDETDNAAAVENDKDGVKILDEFDATDMTRMAASTGNKTFAVAWTDAKKS